MQALEDLDQKQFFVWKRLGGPRSDKCYAPRMMSKGPFACAEDAVQEFREEFALATGYEWEKRFAPPKQKIRDFLWLETDPTLPDASVASYKATEKATAGALTRQISSHSSKIPEQVLEFVTKIFTAKSIHGPIAQADKFWFQMVSWSFVWAFVLKNRLLVSHYRV